MELEALRIFLAAAEAASLLAAADAIPAKLAQLRED